MHLKVLGGGRAGISELARIDLDTARLAPVASVDENSEDGFG